MRTLGTEEIVGLLGLVAVAVASYAIYSWWGLLGFAGGLLVAVALVLAWVRSNQPRR